MGNDATMGMELEGDKWVFTLYLEGCNYRVAAVHHKLINSDDDMKKCFDFFDELIAEKLKALAEEEETKTTGGIKL